MQFLSLAFICFIFYFSHWNKEKICVWPIGLKLLNKCEFILIVVPLLLYGSPPPIGIISWPYSLCLIELDLLENTTFRTFLDFPLWTLEKSNYYHDCMLCFLSSVCAQIFITYVWLSTVSTKYYSTCDFAFTCRYNCVLYQDLNVPHFGIFLEGLLVCLTSYVVLSWTDYLVDEGTECNSTSDLLLERNREQSLVDLLVPTLVLLINLLQKLKVCFI